MYIPGFDLYTPNWRLDLSQPKPDHWLYPPVDPRNCHAFTDRAVYQKRVYQAGEIDHCRELGLPDFGHNISKFTFYSAFAGAVFHRHSRIPILIIFTLPVVFTSWNIAGLQSEKYLISLNVTGITFGLDKKREVCPHYFTQL